MPNLAIAGGEPLVRQRLGSPWPVFDDRERTAVMEVAESAKWGRWAYAAPADSRVGQFEAAFAAFQDARHALGVSNGTVAIEVALRASGVGHTQPLYRHPIFAGQPALKRVCPQAERISEAESWSLGHAVFLGPQSDMDLILDAIWKLRRNVDELGT